VAYTYGNICYGRSNFECTNCVALTIELQLPNKQNISVR
jgi:hypothetical protein